MFFFFLFSASFFHTAHSVFGLNNEQCIFFTVGITQLLLLPNAPGLLHSVHVCYKREVLTFRNWKWLDDCAECVVTRTDEWHFALFYLEPVASLCEPGNLRKTASRLNRKISPCFHLNWEIMNKDTTIV